MRITTILLWIMAAVVMICLLILFLPGGTSFFGAIKNPETTVQITNWTWNVLIGILATLGFFFFTIPVAIVIIIAGVLLIVLRIFLLKPKAK